MAKKKKQTRTQKARERLVMQLVEWDCTGENALDPETSRLISNLIAAVRREEREKHCDNQPAERPSYHGGKQMMWEGTVWEDCF